MNVLTKAASAVAAVAVLAGITVPVSAVDSTLELLTQSTEIFGGYSLRARKDLTGLIGEFTDSGYIDGFISVTDDDLKKWRNTGNFKYNNLKVNGKISWDNLLLAGDNSLLLNVDSDGNIEKYYAID